MASSLHHHQHNLFPTLPPELRNEIYTYLSSTHHDHPATTTSLPLKLKSFTCRHTTLQICPVHYGSASLLSLQSHNFIEASEYQHYLLQNGIELRIGIVFKGRVNTFVQEDWDKRVKVHLGKLVRGHGWLGKVSRVDVRILWEPVDGVLRCKRGKKGRSVGGIVGGMVGSVLGALDKEVLGRKGDVKIRVGVEHDVVVQNVLGKTELGLGEGLKGDFGARKVVCKVGLVKPKRKEEVKKMGRGLVPVRTVEVDEKSLIAVEGDVLSWMGQDDECVVMRREVDRGKVVDTVVKPVPAEHPDGLVLHFLAEDCIA